jgi:hypothetical protein
LIHKGTKANGPSVVSYGASVGLPGATYVGFPSAVFERAVLSRLREIDPQEILPTGGDAAARALALSGKLASVEERIEAIKARLEATDEDVGALMDVVRRLETNRARLVEELAAAQREAASPLKTAWGETRSLLDVLEHASDLEDSRVRLRAVLRRVVDEIWCLFVNRSEYPAGNGRSGRLRIAAVQVWFAGGKHRDYLIIHRAAHANAAARQEPRTWARSFIETAEGALDLRKRKDAAKLLGELQRMDLSAMTGGPAQRT